MKPANVVDSSAWLEYLGDTARAKTFAAAIEDTENLVVPAICVFEVFRKVRRERGESEALLVTAAMQAGRVEPVDLSLALEAARHDLPLADSLIYATARRHDAILWTQDEHFKDLPGVRRHRRASPGGIFCNLARIVLLYSPSACCRNSGSRFDLGQKCRCALLEDISLFPVE